MLASFLYFHIYSVFPSKGRGTVKFEEEWISTSSSYTDFRSSQPWASGTRVFKRTYDLVYRVKVWFTLPSDIIRCLNYIIRAAVLQAPEMS